MPEPPPEPGHRRAIDEGAMGGDDDAFPIRDVETTTKPRGRLHTDVFMGLVFFVVMVGMIALTVVGFMLGDTRRLTHGHDYAGRMCGVDQMKDKPYLYYCGFLERSGDYPKHLNYQSTTCLAACPSNTSEKVACVMPEYFNSTMLGKAVQGSLIFDATFDVQITQSVAYQQSYPTELHLSRYCVPKRSNTTDLYAHVVNGPLKQVSQFNDTIESFKKGWPVVVASVVLATVLGLVYLYTLKKFAGILLYYTIWLGMVITALFGIFFFIGLFFDPYDELGWYQISSPIFVMCPGVSARLVSALVGCVFFATCVCFFFSAKNERIDDTIGLIDAACDCVLGEGSHGAFIIQPLSQAFASTALAILLFVGYMCVASVTYVDTNLISMNGEYPPLEPYGKPLLGKERRTWYWDLAMHFYVFGSAWILVTFVGFCQYVTSHAICDWFFVEAEEIDNPALAGHTGLGNVVKGKAKRLTGLSVTGGGPEQVKGLRSGYLTKVGGSQVMVIPVGNERIRMTEKITFKSLPLTAMLQGIVSGVWYHLGTFAIGGVVCLATWPLRVFSEVFKTFAMGRGLSSEDKGVAGLVIGGLGLLATLLDEVFGRYSKNIFTDVVLRSSDFTQASNDAYDFITDAGGAVAMLHGVCGQYEIVGIIVITAACTMLSYFMIEGGFSDESSPNYVPSPGMLCLVCSVICLIISSGFIGLIALASDGLLYTFLYARTNCPEKLETCMPHSMRYMFANEIESVPPMALEAQPRNRLARFSHAASKYGDNVMASIKGSSSGRPLLAGTR